MVILSQSVTEYFLLFHLVHTHPHHQNNVIIKKHGTGVTAAICDFGQARLLGAGNESGLTTGLNTTPRYIAPEILEALQQYGQNQPDEENADDALDRGGRLTTKEADVYALALTSLEVSQLLFPEMLLSLTNGTYIDCNKHSAFCRNQE